MLRTALVALLCLSSAVFAAEPTADDILKKYDEVMGPYSFEAVNLMVAHREDGTTRSYTMRILKQDTDKFRVWFDAPSSVKGQEMLRSGDNLWLYLPNLKRATRVANRDSFQGGDFNNADVLRVNYRADYAGTLAPSDVPETHCVKLKAKRPDTSYDAITLWVRKSDLLPVKGQYFGTSGQMLRSAVFSDFKEFDKGYLRPAHVVMRNELVKERFSEMTTQSIKTGVTPPAQRFTQGDLGR